MAKAASPTKRTVVTYFTEAMKDGATQHTQGAFRYAETDVTGKKVLKSDIDGIAIGGLYLRKARFGETNPPKRLKVTVEEIE